MGLVTTGPQRANLTQWNGVALPAGGFSVRATSTQNISPVIGGGATDTDTAISAVTLARAFLSNGSCSPSTNAQDTQSRTYFTTTTNVRTTKINSAGAVYAEASVVELV